MGDLINGPIGNVGSYDVAFAGGALVLSATEKDAFGSTLVQRSISAGAVIDALEKAIPGAVAKEVFEAIRLGLGVVSPAPAV